VSVEWLVIRGSGVAAFALLTAATVWGLLVSSKLLGRLVKAKPLTWFHESLGVGALIATVVHVVVLSLHDFLDFSWTEILVPGVSDWRPLAVGMGVAAFYGLVVVAGSFYMKRWIGQRRWRAIHFASLGVFVSSLVHGIWAGTDTSVMIGLYLGAAIVVFSLVAIRITEDMAKTVEAAGAPRETSGRST
jgi:DMSO/TMAO reductase YedYZ heme-binding membrane subunit